MRRHRIVVLALPGVIAFDLGVPAQVFGAARDEAGRHLYEVTTCGDPVRSNAGFTVVPDHGLAALATADTVIVAGVEIGSPMITEGVPPAVVAALRAAATRARLISICTGAFVLAEAGLLDGRPATTHWAHAGFFRARYEKVDLDPDVLFVDDGAVLTSAGVAAGIDLCLHVIRNDHGSAVANGAARRCVVPAWRDGGQSQFIERSVPDDSGATTAPTRAWALENLGEPLDLRILSGHARMSVRTYTRRFREETGLSPARWLARQRVERARHLLESTDLPIDRVAELAGFGTATSLRQHLHAVVGVAPAAYRTAFRR